jgi:drug/metabolite transporter (DMT)-like permease
MFVSALAFTFLNVFVKSVNHFSVYQIVFFRALGSLFFTFPFLVKNKISVLGYKRGLLVLRGVFGLISMGLFFLSLKYLEVIFTVIVGLLWFDEIYTFWSIAGMLLIVIGLTLNVATKKNKL